MRKLLILILLLAVAWGYWAYLLKAPTGPTVETFVVIPPRTGARQVADLLQQRGIIWNRYAFLAWRAYRRGTLKAGEYRFDHPASMTEVYGRLLRGDVYTLAVTVPEGYNLFDTASAFEAAGLTTANQFLAEARTNADLIAAMDPQAKTLEGYLFPDTYRFPPAMSVREMQSAMVKRFRQQAAALGIVANFHEAVTLASLVEKETGAARERGLVASVFVNRLHRGMPLATDPSVVYGLLLSGSYRGALYASDLKGNGMYNTYVHPGLPPGPICSPGVASLTAVAHAPTTDYLYFVSDNAGHSRFAATLDEHNRNVAIYRHDLKQQGGR